MDSTILLLPDELLERIVGLLSTQETLNLSLVHSRFTKLCQRKLVRQLYIYNDDKFFKFTKKARYLDESLKFTVVGLSRFTQLLNTGRGSPSAEFQTIIVANDDIAYLDYYEFMQRKKLPVQFDRIRGADVERWWSTQKNVTRDVQTLAELGDLKRKSQLLAQAQHFTKHKTSVGEHFLVIMVVLAIFAAAMYYFGFFSGSLLDILLNPATQIAGTFDEWLN
ncbi:hypothetical protein Cantr_05073 [Candida viswanathii]|uniref:F-box domain-containing protein n=1 Tax=Candida viswanathii TaxID=5486 RepID=A0A367XU95_9ASCO|nr:hypothetical protein Cantr_05078 [Candida viswanathii]RCK56382.1 hypothetical protein Cantr_05073 [Candida viswanathii]